eukprot:1181231-Prorocentrum_minimum.AAC.2
MLWSVDPLAVRSLAVDVDVRGINTDVTGTNADVRGISADVRGVNADVRGTNTDVTGTNTDVRGINADLMVSVMDPSAARSQRRVRGLEESDSPVVVWLRKGLTS